MTTSSNKYNVALFLLGGFSMTQVHLVGNIGISELVLFICAPVIFVTDYHALRRQGFLPLIWLLVLCCVGCVISSLVNHTPVPYFARGLATPYALFCTVVVGRRLVSRSLNGIKWFVLGVAVSVTINIFMFQQGVEADAYAEGARGMSAVDGIMNGKMFWITRLNAWMDVFLKGWYLSTPLCFSVAAPLLMCAFSMLSTDSGRSAAITALGAAMMVVLGQKSCRQMRLISRHIVLISLVALILTNAFAAIYKYTALNGALGEDALKKYELQMRGRKEGLLSYLLGGRMEFFVGAYACIQRPIVGYGPWAVDQDNYYGTFLEKYGTDDDYRSYIEMEKWWRTVIGMPRLRLIPGHSHIIGFWLWYGIFGLLFWVYVLIQVVRFLRKDVATVPQWFGFLAVALPSFLWNVFFSPLTGRIPTGMFLVALMMTRAIRMGSVRIPDEMLQEMSKCP